MPGLVPFAWSRIDAGGSARLSCYCRFSLFWRGAARYGAPGVMIVGAMEVIAYKMLSGDIFETYEIGSLATKAKEAGVRSIPAIFIRAIGALI